MNSKKWTICLLISVLLLLIMAGSATVVIDPFFHFHSPLPQLTYPIDTERYQNDGIVRHFDYDAIITGTSMTENFKASELDSLFGVHTVKVCFNGTTYTEVTRNLERAIQANPNIRMILSSMEGWYLFDEKGLMRSDVALPEYLYDQNPLNDVSYVLNKEVLFLYTARVIGHTLEGAPTTNFDDYSSWYTTFSREVALAAYDRPPKADSQRPFTDAERQNLVESLTENSVEMARKNPQIQFYYFFPPYSVLTWDTYSQYGELERQLQAYTLASQILLQEENIHLFAFFDDFETVTNLDNYIDGGHYSPDINSKILQRMAQGENELTLDNYQAYWDQIATYYRAYPYDTLF